MKKKGKPERAERYWKKFGDHVQRGLTALNIIGALPKIEAPKPNKAVRIFLTSLEERFGKDDLEIKKQTVMTILGYIRTGFIAAVDSRGEADDQERARWFLKIAKKLGMKMSITDALEILDGLDSMDQFLLHQAQREFLRFFHEKKGKKMEEKDEVVDDDDFDDDEEEEENPAPDLATVPPEDETPERFE